MHIALVAPLIARSAMGLSSYIVDLVPRLCDAGHRVTVLGTDCGYRGSPSGELVEMDERAAFRVFQVRGRFNRRLYRSPEMSSWFDKSIQDFDVVDIQGTWSWIAADIARSCRRAGVGYLFTPHGMMTRWDWQKHPIAKRIFFLARLRTAWRSAVGIRYLSIGELECSGVPEAPYAVIPNAMDVPCGDASASTAALREHFGIAQETALVLFIGRVTDQKGVLELLEAFDLIQWSGPAAQLVIAGPLEGEYGEAVKERAAAMGTGKVKLLGPIFGDAKCGLLKTASLFVTLSKNEGLPIAALEALAMGVPVVLTRESNLPEVEAGGAGIITDHDPATIANHIEGMLLDPGRLELMGRNARRVAHHHFSWNSVLPRLLDLYERVAERTLSQRKSN